MIEVAQARDAVLENARALIRRHSATEEQRRLLEAAFDRFSEKYPDVTLPSSSIHIPILVYAAITGDGRPAVPLAAVTTIAFAGIDLLDDIADNDIPAVWRGYGRAEWGLAANLFISCLPVLAIAELDAPEAVRGGMQAALAAGLTAMAAGQQADLHHAGSADFTREEVERSVQGKSGEESAMFTRLAAVLAQAPAQRVERFAAMGKALGTGFQLMSDCYDLLRAERSGDLVNGTRTLPLAICFERLQPAGRDEFLRLLEAAGREEAARTAVRELILSSGALREMVFIIEVYRQRALRELGRAAPAEPAATALRALIGLASFFHEEGTEEKRTSRRQGGIISEPE